MSAAASLFWLLRDALGLRHFAGCVSFGLAMQRLLATAALAAISFSASAERRAVIHDPIALNIGVNCQWQPRCMKQQREAMNRALRFVTRSRLPQWRIQLCNRNAGRGGNRVDWIGFEHCIRNARLHQPAMVKKRKRP